MNTETLNAACKAADVFLERAMALATEWADGGDTYSPPKLSGALRRASMDLTRALADLRRPG